MKRKGKVGANGGGNVTLSASSLQLVAPHFPKSGELFRR